MKKYLFIVLVSLILSNVNAQDEHQTKAFFIYNFTRLIEWPKTDNSAFVIGVIGNSPIVKHLQTITNGKTVANQKIVIKHFKSPEEIDDCSIIYVSYFASSKISLIQNMVKNHHTLIVAEKDGLTEEGAAINFIINNNRLSFHINIDNAQKYGLKVSKSLVDMSS